MVVSLAAAGGDEAVAFVKCAGGQVGFAEFEKDAADCGAAELVGGGEEERRRVAWAKGAYFSGHGSGRLVTRGHGGTGPSRRFPRRSGGRSWRLGIGRR